MDDCQIGNSVKDSPAAKGNVREVALIQRILDANLNRAAEGLRVAEEYARFVLEDPFLSKSLKEARHQLSKSIRCIGGETTRLAYRDVSHDIGREISLPTEAVRGDLKDVAYAALKRTEQALRSLAEFGKTLSSDFAQVCEALRYETYTLEKALLGIRDPGSKLSSARVYVLLDGKQSLEQFEEAAREIAGVADMIQLRDKTLTDAKLLERAKRLRTITRESNCIFIVNDRPDVAVLAEADGVHVGQDEIGVHDARRLMGEKAIIGVSTHSTEQLHKAILDGASYLGCGPVFTSNTKAFDRFPGTDFLKQAAQETSLPSFAIGGISLDNLDHVIDAGFGRVAVQSAVSRPNVSPMEVVNTMKAKLTSAVNH